jgi:uncharacterized protein (TIGR02271 family)
MTHPERYIVVGKEGLRGTIERRPTEISRDSDERIILRLEDGRQILIPVNQLNWQEDSSYYLPLSLAELDEDEWSSTDQLRVEEKMVVPIVAETFEVQKQLVETGKVRVSKFVREEEQHLNIPLLHEEVEVERVAVNRPLSGPVEVRYEGDTMIVPVVEEILVVEKRLVLKEELHIRKRQVETTQTYRDTLRHEEVVVDRLPADEHLQREARV